MPRNLASTMRNARLQPSADGGYLLTLPVSAVSCQELKTQLDTRFPGQYEVQVCDRRRINVNSFTSLTDGDSFEKTNLK